MEFLIIEKYYRTPHLNPLPALTGRGKGEAWGFQSVIRHDFWRMCGGLMYFVSFIFFLLFIFGILNLNIVWNLVFGPPLFLADWDLILGVSDAGLISPHP